MTDTVIRAEGLGKDYMIPDDGSSRPKHLRDAITQQVLQILQAKPKAAKQRFVALDDVSFTVKAGERVGLMGVNGAGKSTLVKILSSIIKPTRGRAEITGRMGTLLEIGLGFHDEMTGTENIYMMGALYGMEKAEIRAQFDSIVAFAGVENFLRMPVKHFSSGMRARLGFAVAAHLRSDVLLMDEALAVGDMAFQEKCLEKMHAISRDGRTVLLVSHSDDAIRRFCDRALLLEQGRLVMDTTDIDAALLRCAQTGG